MEAYSRHTRYWHECGARLIGGCCRTKPSDIQTIAEWARA
ncbi:homocysteine S-methyltransferase family protein [Domibacillus indicus]|nr:homocysteine S-methyltransferase family protein [Domibacillus indicus]